MPLFMPETVRQPRFCGCFLDGALDDQPEKNGCLLFSGGLFATTCGFFLSGSNIVVSCVTFDIADGAIDPKNISCLDTPCMV